MEEPKPPFLMIRGGQSFWIQRRQAREASATLQAFEEGCFRNAYCYDATGGLWPVVNATLIESSSLLHRSIPWTQVPVELHLGPRTEAPLEEVVLLLAAVLRVKNEFTELLRPSAADILKRFQNAVSPSQIIQIALACE